MAKKRKISLRYSEDYFVLDSAGTFFEVHVAYPLVLIGAPLLFILVLRI